MRCVYLCGCQETGAAMAATPRQEFGEFYQAVFGRLVGQLVLVIGDLHEAEDIAQEALARAAARWSRLRDYDVPEAWVRRVALNLIVSNARRTRRRLRALAGLQAARVVPAGSEVAVALIEALRCLPVRHGEALGLHYLLELPVEEATRGQTSAPGAHAVWRRGHRRRRTKVAGGVVLLPVGLVATGTVGQALLRNPTRPTVGGTVAVPSSTPSRSLSCPKGPVAC